MRTCWRRSRRRHLLSILSAEHRMRLFRCSAYETPFSIDDRQTMFAPDASDLFVQMRTTPPPLPMRIKGQEQKVQAERIFYKESKPRRDPPVRPTTNKSITSYAVVERC